MKNKGFFKTAAALLAALVLLGGFSVPAYAGGGEDIPTDDSGVIVETEPQPLTPDGNLSLIDDIEGEAAEDKQFIVVQSKNGNYFYIIVDRAAEGENTVHFLNQVDEADLMALMEDGSGKAQAPAVCTCKDKCKAGAVNTACPVCSVNMTECAGKKAVPEPDDAPPEKEKSNARQITQPAGHCMVLKWFIRFFKNTGADRVRVPGRSTGQTHRRSSSCRPPWARGTTGGSTGFR